MAKTQKEVFLTGEGDAWIKRNADALSKRRDFHFLDPFLPYLNKKSSVLEIGAGAGHNLNYLSEQAGAQCFGIDPASVRTSTKKSAPKIEVGQATADDFSFDRKFDFIFFGFCLYLCDRALLPKIVHNANFHLKEGGYLGIIDFDPAFPLRRKYAHARSVQSYKMDYSQMFLGFPSYSLVSKKSYSHASAVHVSDEQERVATWVLYKNSELGYAEV